MIILHSISDINRDTLQRILLYNERIRISNDYTIHLEFKKSRNRIHAYISIASNMPLYLTVVYYQYTFIITNKNYAS